MTCRCYHGGEGRTRMKQMKLQSIDAFAVALGVLFLAAIIVMRRFHL